MKTTRRFSCPPGAILPALFIAIGIPLLPAENISPEQIQALQTDAKAASEAISQVAQKTDNDDVKKDAQTAGDAVGRIIAELDKHAANATASTDIYDGGKKYPPIANVSIKSFNVPTGSTEIHVPVTMDKPSANTVIAYVRVFNGQGGRAMPDATKPVIFRPGDQLTKTVSFDVSGMSEGNNVKAIQPSVPDGANRQGGEILITAAADATNEPIEDTSRQPLKFEPLGTLSYSGTGETIQYDDKGGPNTFSTALSHGRTQVGNGETGYYGTVDMGGLSRTSEGLVLSSRRLDKPMEVGAPAMYYPFLATMLSGHKMPETWFKYGSVEWVVKMPNRKGSWPALWLVPTGGWPPEIDVYEGFGYNGSWKFDSDLSTNLHGGKNTIRTFTRPAMNMKMRTFGLEDTLDSDFHTFAVTVTEEWITMFIDGVETMRYANPFKGQTWYPLTNVAVKADPKSDYSDGSGDMILRTLKVWRAE
ncbi:glycosyl hydrolases family 16 [Terrimicrobium sacchariphilum]|jgi:hypothetical protein|uniref:Glycosyl hydrolases family 16 n=1 Tax=Terrimicrobium sacchariphilum TaxID=690879 RepID=A0A146GBU1_TERSA|nr:family 16 glycosylhydrolase [Terrimicrobium sacchariphilum]GAT34673.1 glycosyl hydrolases family 16 [Terrimicrobium sacchariphilum]